MILFAGLRKSIASLEGRMLLVAMVLTLTFWALAWLIGNSDTVSQFDASVMQSVYSSTDAEPFGSSGLGGTARDITSLGSPILLILFTICCSVWVGGHRDRNGLYFLLAVMVGATILSFLLKALISRDRPDVAAAYIDELTFSFPSGHTLLSSALYPTMAIIFLRQEGRKNVHSWFLAIAILMTFLVGLSRIILGAHYPTDVLAGWSVGFAWVGLCRAGLARKDRSEREAIPQSELPTEVETPGHVAEQVPNDQV